MIDINNLRKLSRAELLELLLAKSRETDMLRQRLEKAEVALVDRSIRIAEAGDLAHAVLSVNGVMEAAQAAAKQYLDNMELMVRQTKQECDRMLEEARAEAERIRAAAVPVDELMEEVSELLDDNG